MVAAPEWLSAERAVELAIAFTLAEGAVLLGWHRLTGRGLAPRQLLPMLGAGLFLMLALRASVAGATLGPVAAALAAAGLAHALDLARRWERGR
jgi:hypothetical protein